MRRTGQGSRFLLGTRTTPTPSRLLLSLLVGALALGTCLGLVAGCALGLREVLNPRAPMYRLRTPTRDERPGDAVRASVTFQGTPVRYPPFCVVVHEHYVSGRNGGWRADGRWTHVSRAESERLSVLPNTDVRFDPFDPRVVPEEGEGSFRAMIPALPAGGRLRAQCVYHRQPVFVEGCLSGRGRWLAGCDGEALVLTTGDGTAQPRIDAHASSVAGKLSAGAIALLLVAGYLWYVVRSRPLAAALLRRAGEPPAFDRVGTALGVVGLALAFALGQALMVAGAHPGSAGSRWRVGYLVGLAVCAVAGVMALLVRHRRRHLELAMKPVLDAPTVGLREAWAGVVELAVSVRANAEVVRGPVDGKPHAWLDLRVDETSLNGRNQATHFVRRASWPARVPIADSSGEGWLDLTHAEVDLRSTVVHFRQGSRAELSAAVTASPVGRLDARPNHRHWTLEQSVLDPGERLYVLGRCARVEDPRAVGSYRADVTVPILGGTPEERIVVHAGSERSLLRSIDLERGYLDLLAATLVGVAASMAAVMAALWSL